MMMSRKKRRTIVISIIIIIFIILVSIFVGLYLTTDMFKPSNVLFEKYAVQLFNDIDIILNEENMKEVEQALNNNKLNYNSISTANYTENGNDLELFNNIQLNINGKTDKTEKYDYKNISLTQNENTLFGAEYIEDNNIAGIRLNGIKQYLSTEINNKEKSKINNIYELINIEKTNLFFSQEELDSLKEKYIRILIDNITNAKFSKETNIVMKINDVEYITNKYNVTMTKEKFNDIYMKILEQLKEEQIVLSKLELIDEKINQYYSLIESENTSNLKQTFSNKINETIQKIQNSNIGNEERTISVFEANGVPISFSIDTEEYFICLDIINEGNNNFIEFLGNEKVETDEKENSFDLKIQKEKEINNEEWIISYNILEEGQEISNEFNISRNMEGDSINNIVELTRKIDNNELKILFEQNIDVVQEFENIEKLQDNENNVIVENLSDEQKESIKNGIDQNISEQINNVLQVISLDNINKMLINLNLKQEDLEELSSSENVVTELEKSRFNSTFELYEGEKITKERVKELIDISKENLGDVRISNYKEERDEKIPLEYRLVIERGKYNEELADSVVQYIEENYSEDFSVRLEYDETTGLINNIYITVMEN